MADESAGTIVGEVTLLDQGPRRIAPVTGKERATLRNPLRVVACWRLNDHMFAFGSSFVSPDLAPEMQTLADLNHKYTDAPISVFGHADPVGDDNANQVLSGRRARAIHALLTRKSDIWEELFSKPEREDDWGNRSIQHMLRTIQRPPEGGDPLDLGDDALTQSPNAPQIAAALGQTVPYYTGPITTNRTEATTAAIRRFQKDHGLKVDGDPGPQTREALFFNYMEAICTTDAGVAFSMSPDRFVGQGKDKGGHADFQACSEFNPVLVFSKEETAKFEKSADKTARNAANTTNRRVMIFFFDPDAVIQESEWPCPRVADGSAGCKALFWPDGDKRRAPSDKRRKFSETGDTFACRFYDSLARRSPCEGIVQRLLEVKLFDDQIDPQPVFDAQYRIKLPGGTIVGAAADGLVSVLVASPPSSVEVEWSPPDDEPLTADGGDARFRLVVHIDVESGDADTNASRRLHNLGFFDSETLKDNLLAFQLAYGLPQTGTLDDATSARLQQVHDSAEPDPDLSPKSAPGAPEGDATDVT